MNNDNDRSTNTRDNFEEDNSHTSPQSKISSARNRLKSLLDVLAMSNGTLSSKKKHPKYLS